VRCWAFAVRQPGTPGRAGVRDGVPAAAAGREPGTLPGAPGPVGTSESGMSKRLLNGFTTTKPLQCAKIDLIPLTLANRRFCDADEACAAAPATCRGSGRGDHRCGGADRRVGGQ